MRGSHIVDALRDILEHALVLPKVVLHIVACGLPHATSRFVSRVAGRGNVVRDITRATLDAKVAQAGWDVRDQRDQGKVVVDGCRAVGALRSSQLTL